MNNQINNNWIYFTFEHIVEEFLWSAREIHSEVIEMCSEYSIGTSVENIERITVVQSHKALVITLLFIKHVRFSDKVAISILFCQKYSSYDVYRYPHRLVYITTLRIARNLEAK